MKSPEIDPHAYGLLIFQKRYKGNLVVKAVFSSNGAGTI